VDVGGDQDEDTPGIVKEQPSEQQRGKKANKASRAADRPPARRRRGQTAQTGRADEPVLMLYDTLTAIMIGAIRTAADRFPVRMMKATLVGKCGDRGILIEKGLRVLCAAKLAGGAQ